MVNVIIGILLFVFTFFLLRQDATGRLWMPGVIGVFALLLAYWFFNRDSGQKGKKK